MTNISTIFFNMPYQPIFAFHGAGNIYDSTVWVLLIGIFDTSCTVYNYNVYYFSFVVSRGVTERMVVKGWMTSRGRC